MDDILPNLPRKGRGAVSNKTRRFEPHDHVRVDDGWPGDDEEPPPLRNAYRRHEDDNEYQARADSSSDSRAFKTASGLCLITLSSTRAL